MLQKKISRPINEIAQIYGQLQTAIAGAERVFTVLDESDEDKSGEVLVKEERLLSHSKMYVSLMTGNIL